MSNLNPIFFLPSSLSPSSHISGNRGIMLCLVAPQPACRLVYRTAGDHCGTWGYPEKTIWEKWNDEDYKLPERFEAEDHGSVWVPPCHTGDILPMWEPWAFLRCHDCYACESPQVRYHGKAGCFIYPTPHSTTNFHPARTMPAKAARSTLLVTRVQMMRLQKVPAAQYNKDGFICQDGNLFPEDLSSVWNKSLDAQLFSVYGWEKNPFVWVVWFEKRKGKMK